MAPPARNGVSFQYLRELWVPANLGDSSAAAHGARVDVDWRFRFILRGAIDQTCDPSPPRRGAKGWWTDPVGLFTRIQGTGALHVVYS